MIKKYSYLLLLALWSLPVSTETPVVAEFELVPNRDEERATEIILHIIDNYHYRTKRLDDHLSNQIFDNFLNNLDSNHSFFTAQDIEYFGQYRYKLDDTLRDADLTPAFDIFKIYRTRVDQRVTYALLVLKSEFDFTIEEDYVFDRQEFSWLVNTELDEIWRKRVKSDFLNLKLAGKEADEIRDTLAKRYKRLRTSTFQYNSSDIFQLYVNAYTTAIDPHTSYFSPRTSENFDISMSLSLQGIGAVLKGDSDYTEVQSVVSGGPADLSGELHDQDRVIGVGQGEEGQIIDVIGWRLDDVVDLIRGPKGTVVRLELLRKGVGADGLSEIISITRDKIKLEEQAAKSEIIDVMLGQIGVIDIPTFYSDFAAQARGVRNYKSTTRDVRKLLKELSTEDIDGIVIDLRGNGGGSLSEALELTGLFIETGPVVQTKDSSGKIEINEDRDPSITYSGPLAVLVDRYSASASEIFAGAIQDYRRGIIIGEPTFGKGTVQNIVDLNRFTRSKNDYGKLKTTIAQFFRVSGGSNQYKGVIPDIVYPTAKLSTEHGERSLDNALPWDHVKPAVFVPANTSVERFNLAKLAHERRLGSNRLFQLILQELKLAYESNERKTISLLESKRKRERDRLTEARKVLQNEYRIAQSLEPLADDANDDEYEKTEPIDVLLQEAANILIDVITHGQTTATSLSLTVAP